MGIKEKIVTAKKYIWSTEARKKLEKLIMDTKPDIAHLHIFQHQISPSILGVLKKYNIPIVYTAHDLKMLCPNYRMFSNEGICEKCKGHKYLECTKNVCIKDSKVKSLLGTMEAYFHYFKKSYNMIDKIITPSMFFKNKFIEWGIDKHRVDYIPNFLSTENIKVNKNSQKYFLYFGRLSDEKGIITLINAMSKIKIKLKIVGTGPLFNEIETLIKDKTNIELLGFKSGQELTDIIGNAKAIILPSEWYENGPYSAIESLRLGRPLIGSNLGGIPELIKENVNGYIFKNKDIDELHKCLLKIEKMKEKEYIEMCKMSKKIFDENYTDNIHYKKIIKIYNELLKKY